MSPELHADDGPARLPTTLETMPVTELLDDQHPKLSGDLPTILEAGPMFRRAAVGYDRFQVDAYVRWAEEELAAADREREHLMSRQLRTQAALEEAQELLSHSTSGREFRRVSTRIGSMFATAADQAETMRAKAEAELIAASAQAEQIVSHAQQALADAEAQAARLVAEAVTEADGRLAAAGQALDEAEQTRRDARQEAGARLTKAQAIVHGAVEQGERIRERAVEEASAARLQARDEVLRMLVTAREERRRADAAAAAARERLDREAAARLACLLAEVADLERRRAALEPELDATAEPAAVHPHLPVPLDWIRERLDRRTARGRSADAVAGRRREHDPENSRADSPV